jgi:hypothetical protein
MIVILSLESQRERRRSAALDCTPAHECACRNRAAPFSAWIAVGTGLVVAGVWLLARARMRQHS